jgi:quercetin dioxygenase-like cupin family protein
MDTVALDLTRLADHLLAAAANSPDLRAREHVDLGHGTLRHMAIGFATGGELPAHGNPGEAALQVVRGRVRVSWEEQHLEATPGMLVRIPDATHRVEALEPSVILLTAVSLPGGRGH